MDNDIKAFIEAWQYTPEEKAKIETSENLKDLFVVVFLILVIL